MQTTLEYWKKICKDKDNVKTPTQIDVQVRRPNHSIKDRAAPSTQRKGKALKISQIQGQPKIMSFLEPKTFSKTPSTFQNSSVQIDNSTQAVVSYENLVGSKTTEASNSTGGETEQLSGRKFTN